jgi:hypothetical protein
MMLGDAIISKSFGMDEHEVRDKREVKERRRMVRIKTPALARIRGAGGIGRRLDVSTIVDNIGSGGFYVRLLRPVEPGATLFGLVQFAPTPTGLRLAVRGRVVRVERLPGDVYGVAVKILNHRFL